MRRIPFRVGLRVPVGTVTEREGWLVEGPAGWGECSPLPSWSASEREAAERAAIEAATEPFPAPLRGRVEVNALVPRVAPDEAVRIALASGCRTIKIKVGDPGSIDRVAAVRDALPGARFRLDVNGDWDDITAGIALATLAHYDIEYVEDPLPTLEEIAHLRKGSSVLLAAESCVRTLEDVRRLKELRAADVFVVKPQRIGGVRAALLAAEEAGVPTVPSSALETSVGLAAVLAVAAALPELPFAAGIGTASLLAEDVVDDPLLPVDGALTPRRAVPKAEVLARG